MHRARSPQLRHGESFVARVDDLIDDQLGDQRSYIDPCENGGDLDDDIMPAPCAADSETSSAKSPTLATRRRALRPSSLFLAVELLAVQRGTTTKSPAPKTCPMYASSRRRVVDGMVSSA